MRTICHPDLEKGRVRTGMYGSKVGDLHGAFTLKIQGKEVTIISSGEVGPTNPGADGWEHVSVSIRGSKKTPNWRMMCEVKNLFWTEEETVVQFHPAKSEYRNLHEGCLHLWKHEDIPTPNPNFVAPDEKRAI